MARRLRSWSGHHRATPLGWAWPASEEEVVALVAEASSAGRSVKVVGGGHSFSDIALTDGVVISLDRMRRVLALDERTGRVRVQAGIRLRELVAALARRGWGLPILGSTTAQSLAGAISTATHGSSLRHGNLATLVQAMRLVSGGGEVLHLDESDERLAGVKVGLGALGIITELTLRCEPLATLEETAERVPIDRAIGELEALAASAEYVKIWWLPPLPYANVYRCARADRAPPAARPLARWVDEAVINRIVFTALLRVGRRFPQATAAINRAVGATYLRPRRRLGRYDDILPVALPPRHREMEYAVGMDRAADALGRIRDLIRARRLRINFVVEVRFVRGDDIWMSPAYGRDSCFIGTYMADSPDLPAYFAGVERIMRDLGDRPHWGKEHGATTEEVRTLFPMAPRFLALREALDRGASSATRTCGACWGHDRRLA